MHRTITETKEFTRPEYTCDICGQILKAGKKPGVCYICGRETCDTISCRRYQSFPHDLDDHIVCSTCLGHWDEHFEQLQKIVKEADLRMEEVKSEWKTLSLRDFPSHTNVV